MNLRNLGQLSGIEEYRERAVRFDAQWLECIRRWIRNGADERALQRAHSPPSHRSRQERFIVLVR